MLEELIHNLLKDIELDIEPSKMDPMGYKLDFAPDLSITVKATDPGYYIQTSIDRVPEYEVEILFITLMEANLFGQGTGRGVLGISLDGDLVLFSKKILQDLNYQDFKEKIEEFVNYVEFWRIEIKEHMEKKKRPENA
ncbi:MAG: type III secretion system chaperone [Chlamydiales bacterium]